MAFKVALCLISFGLLAATCLAQIPERFFIESKVDGRVLGVSDELAPPIGGPYERFGVVPVNKNSSNVESWWGINLWDVDLGTIYPANSSTLNTLTTGLQCGHCFGYTHTHNVTIVSGDQYRILRLADGMVENPNTCVKHSGERQFVTEVECNENDDSQLWMLREVAKPA